jgi:exosortase D (VPLPA-CTERM-specific)
MANVFVQNSDRLGVRHGLMSGLPWLAIAALGLTAFYWTGLVSLLEAWARPEYSHGYFIPAIAGFLILRAMRDMEPASDSAHANKLGSGLGVAFVVVGLVVGLLGNLARIADIVTYGLLATLAGFILILAGTRQGLKLWAPWLYLVFMLPLPQFIYLPLSIRLQLLSSEIGVGIISLLGVPVYLDGNIIDLGRYKLQVAEACSGLRYLFPLMSFGFLFALLYRGPVWHKCLLFLITIPITMLMNSVRIGIIGYLVDRYGIEQAEGFLHFFEGWIIFIACVGILLLVALALRYFSSAENTGGAMLDFETRGIGHQLMRLRDVTPSRSLIAASVLVLVAGLAWHWSPAQAMTKIDRLRLAELPTTIGEWQRGSLLNLDPQIERVLAADDYILADYRNGTSGHDVNFFAAYYHSLTSGGGIHSPEVCIPVGGWEVSQWETVELNFRMPSGAPFKVNRAIIQKGTERMIVYYWFEQRGRQLTSDYAVKAFAVWDSIMRGRSDGALIRLTTPILSPTDLGTADERLTSFLLSIFGILPRHVPA